MQLLGEDEVATLLSSKERVISWIVTVKKTTTPPFEEVNKIINKAAARR